MALLDAPYRLVLGDGQPHFYPAHVAIKDRTAPGLRFELAPGRPWRWTGTGGPCEARLVDVLAAATLAHLGGAEPLRRSILAAHCGAAVAALRGGDAALAERLQREQETVVDCVDEWELGTLMDPPVRYRTVKNYKLNGPRRVPPPIQVVGHRQTVWLWARTQAQAWVAGRPGIAWRSGLSDAEIEASGRRLPGRPRRPADA
jgi:hypothetical protein